MSDKKIIVEQVKSLAGRPEAHRKIVRSLGLRRIRHQVEHFDTAIIRGMVNKVPHLVVIRES